MKICKYCNKEMDVNPKVFANHVRWCPENKTNGDKGKKKLSEKSFERYAETSKLIEYHVKCKNCGENFVLNERESRFKRRNGKYFCSYKCQRKRSDECKQKISNITKELWKNEEYANKIITNNTNKNPRFSSKGEEEIKKYLKDNYTNDNWTSGGGFKYDGVRLTRDMYSNKLKVIVEYDGIWHFEDIKGQLADKQMKDNKLEEWVLDNGWRLIRIKDILYQGDKIRWLNILLDAIYNRNEQIIKLYE